MFLCVMSIELHLSTILLFDFELFRQCGIFYFSFLLKLG
jgi:hypothetical protein